VSLEGPIMDPSSFDTLTRSLDDPRSRRGALAALLGARLACSALLIRQKKRRRRSVRRDRQPPVPTAGAAARGKSVRVPCAPARRARRAPWPGTVAAMPAEHASASRWLRGEQTSALHSGTPIRAWSPVAQSVHQARCAFRLISPRASTASNLAAQPSVGSRTVGGG